SRGVLSAPSTYTPGQCNVDDHAGDGRRAHVGVILLCRPGGGVAGPSPTTSRLNPAIIWPACYPGCEVYTGNSKIAKCTSRLASLCSAHYMLLHRKEGIMLLRKPSSIRPSQITPFSVYQQRRIFMARAGSLALAAASPKLSRMAWSAENPSQQVTLPFSRNEDYVVMDRPTEFRDATTYNNFYE